MKSSLFALYLVCLFLPLRTEAQHINDCSNAQVVCSDEALTFNPNGPGFDDFADPDNFPGCITSLEQNSAWYYFQIDENAPPDLVIGFIIHPNGGLGEDYDWALFGPDVECGNLGFPIRCSSSSAQCGFCPETGMGMGTTDVTEGPGTGDGFVMTLIVQPGQGFYLMVDNWLGTSNGFVLEWTDSAAPYLNCNAKPPCAVYAVAPNDIFVCSGDTDIQLNGSSTGTHGGETYSWSGTNGGTGFLSNTEIADPTIDIPPGFSGLITYTLTVSEDTCTNEDMVDVFVNPLPNLTITQVGPFCENHPPQTLTATPAGGTWGGAATGNTFNPMTNGPGIHEVTYTYTDGNTCTNTESIFIEVWAIPDPGISPDPAEFCDNEGSILLTASGTGGAGNYIFHWNTPTEMADGPTYNAMLSGLYMVTVTDDNGCTNTTATTVTAYPNPEVEINDPGPLCVSLDVYTLTATPPGGTFSGSIVDPSGEVFPELNQPGNYSVSYSYTDGNSCEGSNMITITIIPVPESIPDNNGPLCEGEPIFLFGETSGTGAVISYNWSGPNGYSSNLQNPTDATLGGDYILEVTIDGCPSAPAVTTVVVSSAPEAFADNNGPYCGGQAIQLLGSSNGAGTDVTYAWSGPNSYTSDVQSPLDATEAGIYTLVVTIDGCSSTPVQTEIIFNTPPDAAASNSGPYCPGDLIELFGSTTTPGSIINYTWNGPNGYQSSSQNPNDATAPGLYELVVSVDGCNSIPGATSVIVNTLPQPVITGPVAFCTGNSAFLDAGSGYTGYTWEDGSQDQTLEVFSSGTYAVTVDDVNGCTASATFDIVEIPSLSPVITGTFAFCAGSTTTLDAGSGYASYSWSTGESSQTIDVSSGGNFGVIVTDADGCSGSTTITTTVHQNPNVVIGGSTTYCIGGSTVLDAGAGYATYAWSDNSSGQTISVSSPGDYSVSVIDNFGCSGSATATVQESTSLNPVITGSNAFCENGNTTLNAGSGFATYNWSDGSTNQNLLVNVAGSYSVTVSDGQGCSGEATVVVNEVPPPSAVLQPSATLCNTIAGGSVINLYDLVLSGDMNGTWEDKDHSNAVGLFTNLNFNGVTAGDYHFIYTTSSAIAPCPETTYETIVTVLECTCPVVKFFNTAPLCNSGDMLDLSDIENTAEPGTWSMIQTPPGTSPASLTGTLFDATSGDAGQYIFQFSLLNPPPPGCPLDFQVNVNIDAAVHAGVAALPVDFCANEDQLIILPDLLTGEDANGTWTETSQVLSQGTAFNAASGTFKTGNQLPGTYTFSYSLAANGACPADAAEITIAINPLPTVVVDDFLALDCANPVQQLNAEGSSFGPGYTIVWTGPGILADGNENTLHPSIDQQGNYLLTVTDLQSGCLNTATVTVIANTDPPTAALITGRDPSCFGDQNGFISVDQVIGGTPPYMYSLNNAAPANNGIYANLNAGNYTLELVDVNGCKWDTAIILNAPAEINIDLGPDLELGLGESGIVQAIINLAASQIDTMIWSPSNIIECIDIVCLEANVHASNTVTLSATVYDQNGCRATDDIFILVNKDRRVYIPTVFSPNGDGINDLFYIFGDEGQIVNIRKFVIYSRWGETIHEATNFMPNDPHSGWDGTFKNITMNPDVFVYVAEIEFVDGVVKVYQGDVTLMR